MVLEDLVVLLKFYLALMTGRDYGKLGNWMEFQFLFLLTDNIHNLHKHFPHHSNSVGSTGGISSDNSNIFSSSDFDLICSLHHLIPSKVVIH